MEAQDRFAIADVMSRYASGVDDSDMARYKSCFVDDVEIVGMGPTTVNGIEPWLEFVTAALEPYESTQHMMGPQLVELDGNIAHVRTDVIATHFYKEDAPNKTFTLWTTYFSDMQRTSDGWKIKRHELVRRGMKVE